MKPGFGVYVTVPSALRTTVPLAPCVTATTVSGSPSESWSLTSPSTFACAGAGQARGGERRRKARTERLPRTLAEQELGNRATTDKGPDEAVETRLSIWLVSATRLTTSS